MPAYVVAQIEVIDPTLYENYKALAPPAVEAFGGRYLVRGGDTTVLEGESDRGRLVIVEFDDLETAQSFYSSTAYQAARDWRLKSAVSSVRIIQGLRTEPFKLDK